MKIVHAKNYDDLSRKAANIISAQVIMKQNCVLGLATGSTPIGIYRQLIDWYNKGDLDFTNVVSINLDEYVGLPANSPQSYHYFMQNTFFNHININPENVHLLDGMNTDAVYECRKYDRMINENGGIDLQLLGIGLDGHIGFNEPGAAFDLETHCVRLAESTIEANKRFFEKQEDVPRLAYTMGIKSIMQARKILLAVNGENKAGILKKAFLGPVTPEVPASILQLHNNVTVVADEAALHYL